MRQSICPSVVKAFGRSGRTGTGRRRTAMALVAALLLSPAVSDRAAKAQAQPRAQFQNQAERAPIKGELSMSTTGGFGRLVIRLDGEIDAEVKVSSGVLIVQFKQPVAVPVDRVTSGAAQYFGAARRDPDGKALRFALAQKLRVSTMTAGERLFVDLLPESWTGEPPGLPREIVEDLARRAREADKLALQKLALEQQRKQPVVRVRVASQSTFTRYIFELPELTPVSSERSRDNLALTFGAPLRFDLSDAKLSLPPTVSAVDADNDGAKSSVKFTFAQPSDVRTFREDANYVVDVTAINAKPSAVPLVAIGPAVTAPATVPAKDVAKEAAKETAKPEPQTPQSAAADKSEAAADAEKPDAAPQSRPSRQTNRIARAELRRQGDGLKLMFPFADKTAAAMFQRADTLWLVFDTAVPIDVDALTNDRSQTIRSADVNREDDAQVVRLRLERPRLVSVEAEEAGWSISIGDAMQSNVKPITIARNVVTPARTSISIPFDEPRKAHWLNDPEVGDRLLVVTGAGPARGLVRTQEFVDLRALATAHGIAVQPYADDLQAELSVDKVLLVRPTGLTLSEAEPPKIQQTVHALTFDTTAWNTNRKADFNQRQVALIREAAESPFVQRTAHRLDVARFYLSRKMWAEAKSVLDTTIADERPTAADPSPLVLRAIANIMLGRFDSALKDLGDPVVGNQNDAQLWRALVAARQGRWAEAREQFRYVEAALGSLPLELQQIALRDALRASIEVGDFTGAANRLNDFQTIGVSPDIEPEVTVLTGRLAEGVGRINDALSAYKTAAASDQRPAAAQGKLRELSLRYSIGDIKKDELISELESLTTAWRGDETEVQALQKLARLYTEENRYRDAFGVMRVAIRAHPNSELTRAIQDEAAKTFDGLFLAGKGDVLPAIDALSLFYDYRELTPIGRRGDEMIRKLAERLVAVDLLDQAADLLQYQVDNRLQGAARAQVATRLAVIYLMNRKSDKAQAVLRATRTADLSNEIRIPRLLIEARALSDSGRHDFALEVIAGIEGRESLRLRSDIYWASRNWQKAAEHIELLYGDRWKSFEPLSDIERPDILRAAVAYAMAEDKLGVARLRDKYVAKMADGPDRKAFDLVTSGIGASSPEFRNVARIVASGDTLTGFLRDLKARYPEMQGSLSEGGALPQASAPAAAPAKSDPSPTGSIGQLLRSQRARLSSR
ncbi:tetratricopeptide repeat family protein [Rhodoplanes sp. Z2-YC6860]|nr:tetratricopeptide repeat family protein [Rhodoplanes sp. Z2-YC6860]